MEREMDQVEDLQDVVEDINFEDITEQPVVEPETEVEEEVSEPGPEPVEQEETSSEEHEVVEEAEEEEETDEEEVDLAAQNAALREHIEKLSGQLISGGGVATAPAITPKPAAEEEQKSKGLEEVMNFLGETSIDEIIEDPSKFNALLNNVSRRSSETATQQAVQQVLRTVPELVMGYITRHTAMNRIVDDFYRENPDLSSVKQTVAAVANDIHAKNPDLGVEDVFKQSAEATRKLLGIKRNAERVAKRKAAKPAFAKAGGARKKVSEESSLQKQINELISGDF